MFSAQKKLSGGICRRLAMRLLQVGDAVAPKYCNGEPFCFLLVYWWKKQNKDGAGDMARSTLLCLGAETRLTPCWG